jgi:hypothetical protein
MRSFSLAVAGAVCMSVLSGCSKKLKTVSAESQQSKMYSELKSTDKEITTTNLTSLVPISNYPLLQEVCKDTYKRSPSYSFDGTKMRFKMQRFSYKVPVPNMPESSIYSHTYAVCFDFYALNKTSTPSYQEAVFVHYLASKDTKLDTLLDTIHATPGSGSGLLLDAGFHTGDTSPVPNGWTDIARKTYPDDSTEVQYLKMEALHMGVINTFSGSKYDDLLAYEFVHGNVTLNDNGELGFMNIQTAVINDIVRAVPVVAPAAPNVSV